MQELPLQIQSSAATYGDPKSPASDSALRTSSLQEAEWREIEQGLAYMVAE